MATGNFVVYYRVSTKKQGDSGLGLEAQREMVKTYLNGGNWNIVGEYTEIESGTRKGNRPKLVAALEHCRLYGATLLIGKLDRLSRSVAQIAKLLEDTSIKFVCCDNPNADETMLQMLSIMGEWEAKAISKRTTAALAAKKERGELTGASCWGKLNDLGKINGYGTLSSEDQAKGRALAIVRISEKSNEFASRVMIRINELKTANPAISLRGIVAGLEGIPTMKGGQWAAATVMKIIARA